MAGSVSCHRVNIRGVTPCVICTFFLRKPVKWHTPAFKPHFYKHTYVRLLLAFRHEYCFFVFFFYFFAKVGGVTVSYFFCLFFAFNYMRVLDLKLWKQSQYLQRMSPISSQLLTSPLHSLLSAQVLFKEVNNMEKHGLRRQQNPIQTQLTSRAPTLPVPASELGKSIHPSTNLAVGEVRGSALPRAWRWGTRAAVT